MISVKKCVSILSLSGTLAANVKAFGDASDENQAAGDPEALFQDFIGVSLISASCVAVSGMGDRIIASATFNCGADATLIGDDNRKGNALYNGDAQLGSALGDQAGNQYGVLSYSLSHGNGTMNSVFVHIICRDASLAFKTYDTSPVVQVVCP